MNAKRLAEIRAYSKSGWATPRAQEAINELLAEIEALMRDNEWRKDQMEHVWPRNKYGSVLTQGEVDTLANMAAADSLKVENARLAVTLDDEVHMTTRLRVQAAKLAADVATLREAVGFAETWTKSLGDADGNRYFTRVLRNTAPATAVAQQGDGT